MCVRGVDIVSVSTIRYLNCYCLLFIQLYYPFFEFRSFRDRPFNLKGERGGYGFLFRSKNFFRTTQELEYFFPEFNIRLYDKNSESDYFFFLHHISEYIFQQHWESEYFFRKKP